MSEPAGIDLHTHSTCSDGSLTPGELVERAATAGVRMLALTDHDTLAGVAEAHAAADRLGIRMVPGVEISACWRHQSIHVLGLWIDPDSAALRAALEGQAERRRTRMRRMCTALSKMRLPGDELLAAVEAQPGIPTRSHLAAALVRQGHVRRTQDAFRKYLGRGRPAHVAADWPALEEVVGWVREAGGVACLAHPARYPLSSGGRKRLAADFAAAGGTALEVVSRRQRRAECGGLRGARARIRAARLGRLGLSRSATRLESFGAVG